MSYATCHQTFTHKVRDYDAGTCQRALFDCHDTLKIWGDEIDSDYAVKLWAEIDALRERQLKLSKAAA